MDPMARILRNRNRLKHGLRVPEDAKERIKRMEDHLRIRNRVVNYSRERGFFTVDRDPRIDKPDSIVRVPPEQRP